MGKNIGKGAAAPIKNNRANMPVNYWLGGLSKMKWEDVNKVIKWTIENGTHLDVSDIYLIEKATDDCHGYLMSLASAFQHSVAADAEG